MSGWLEGFVQKPGRRPSVASSNVTKPNTKQQLSEVKFNDSNVINDHSTSINQRSAQKKRKNGFVAHRKLRFLPQD
jgi:hypothetical protein